VGAKVAISEGGAATCRKPSYEYQPAP